MYCKNCGAALPQNETKCPKCGADNLENANVSAAGVERVRGFSSKKNIIIIIIAAILLFGGGITAIALTNKPAATSALADKLQLAERYLSEQNYEQAVIAFQQVLEIEPMNVNAYLGLADAYIGLGDTEKALEILREGLERTGDVHIQSKIDELAHPRSSEPASIPTSVPTSEPAPESTAPVFGSMGSVTILGQEYDIATTTKLRIMQSGESFSTDGLKSVTYKISDSDMEDFSFMGSDTPEEVAVIKRETFLSEEEVAVIGKLVYLEKLDLSINNPNFSVFDYLPILSTLTNLKYLRLHSESITDVTPLLVLTNLEDLRLEGNEITNLSPLSGLVNLQYLDIRDNPITDLSPLNALTDLNYLDLEGTKINEADVEALKAKLPNCNISY